MESACTRVNCVFLDQISGTSTGLLVTWRGGSLGGEIASLILRRKPEAPPSHCTSKSDLTGPRGALRKNSLRLSPRLSPNSGAANAGGRPPRYLTGRSTKKSRRFENKILRRDSRCGESSRPINWTVSAFEFVELLNLALNSDMVSASYTRRYDYLDAQRAKRMSRPARLTHILFHCNIRWRTVISSFAIR